jgi:hypothetical protein
VGSIKVLVSRAALAVFKNGATNPSNAIKPNHIPLFLSLIVNYLLEQDCYLAVALY